MAFKVNGSTTVEWTVNSNGTPAVTLETSRNEAAKGGKPPRSINDILTLEQYPIANPGEITPSRSKQTTTATATPVTSEKSDQGSLGPLTQFESLRQEVMALGKGDIFASFRQ